MIVSWDKVAKRHCPPVYFLAARAGIGRVGAVIIKCAVSDIIGWAGSVYAMNVSIIFTV
jgi:hypothetical protein